MVPTYHTSILMLVYKLNMRGKERLERKRHTVEGYRPFLFIGDLVVEMHCGWTQLAVQGPCNSPRYPWKDHAGRAGRAIGRIKAAQCAKLK